MKQMREEAAAASTEDKGFAAKLVKNRKCFCLTNV